MELLYNIEQKLLKFNQYEYDYFNETFKIIKTTLHKEFIYNELKKIEFINEVLIKYNIIINKERKHILINKYIFLLFTNENNIVIYNFSYYSILYCTNDYLRIIMISYLTNYNIIYYLNKKIKLYKSYYDIYYKNIKSNNLYFIDYNYDGRYKIKHFNNFKIFTYSKYISYGQQTGNITTFIKNISFDFRNNKIYYKLNGVNKYINDYILHIINYKLIFI